MKLGYVLKILNNNIKVIYYAIHIYNKKYKKLLIKNIYIKIYDKRNELILKDYILFNLYKKSKTCIYRVLKIL